MAQILPDEGELDPSEDAELEKAVYRPPSFGAALGERPPLEASHANLTRTLWIRRMIEHALEDQTVRIIANKAGELCLELERGLPSDLVGYATSVGSTFKTFKLWGMSGKMQCPTWDLTAGAPWVGGSCPAAAAGQSIVDAHERKTMLDKHGHLKAKDPDGRTIKFYEGDEGGDGQWKTPICQSCYASGGNYRELTAAIGNTVRYHWTKHLLQADPGLWIDTVVASMKLLHYFPQENGIRPARIHSSGDFFSQAYAAAWVEVANRIYKLDPAVKMWAPTRSWATQSWKTESQDAWHKLLDPKSLVSAGDDRPNLIVRCSAYHTGDHAPGALHPSNAVGTTAIFRDDNAGEGKDDRYDLGCPVYSTDVDANTCQWAHDPTTGRLGCRICWTQLGKRVNFTVH
ncbi:MAG: hypothetical protein WC729_29565 [Sphingomonas sp.]|jgi:hypothetical protein|uniref:GP88 family protein n=1 Tax=Sphingomonas sp. TaxID=28214 RepID=UPI0035679949